MKTPNFTPGPWEYNDPEKFEEGHGTFSETAVYAPGNLFPWRMAEVQGPDMDTEIANARLIAAAPALYEALRDMLPLAAIYLSGAPSHPDNAKLEDARAALAMVESPNTTTGAEIAGRL